MAWKDITQDGSVRYFTFTDSIGNMHDMFFSFWLNVTPGFLVLMMVIFTSLTVTGIIFSINKAIKRGAI